MAGARHGMCELLAWHGRETAWAWHAMCELAFTAAALAADITMTGSKRHEISTEQTINLLCWNGGSVL